MSYLEATTFFHPISDKFYARVKTCMISSSSFLLLFPLLLLSHHEWMIFRFYNSIAQFLPRASISSPFVIYLSIYLSIHPSIYSFIIFLSLVRPHPHDASIIRRNNLRRHHDANEDSLGLKRPSLLTAYAFFIIGRVRSRSASTWDTFSEAAFPVSLFADVYIYTTTGRHWFDVRLYNGEC